MFSVGDTVFYGAHGMCAMIMKKPTSTYTLLNPEFQPQAELPNYDKTKSMKSSFSILCLKLSVI